ncbi:MAG: hypothetical protein SOZ07_04105 [Prevotella sp.]|nr:hypothetical protein [Prevotella sp.]
MVISLIFCIFIGENQQVTKLLSDDYQGQNYRNILYFDEFNKNLNAELTKKPASSSYTTYRCTPEQEEKNISHKSKRLLEIICNFATSTLQIHPFAIHDMVKKDGTVRQNQRQFLSISNTFIHK